MRSLADGTIQDEACAAPSSICSVTAAEEVLLCAICLIEARSDLCIRPFSCRISVDLSILLAKDLNSAGRRPLASRWLSAQICMRVLRSSAADVGNASGSMSLSSLCTCLMLWLFVHQTLVPLWSVQNPSKSICACDAGRVDGYPVLVSVVLLGRDITHRVLSHECERIVCYVLCLCHRCMR